MQWMRHIMILGFALVIFTGTVGINVFTHFCREDGLDYSYLAPPSHSCETEAAEESCCHDTEKEAASSGYEIRKNCCQEAVSTFKISSDYTQKSADQVHFELIPAKAISCVFCEEMYATTEAASAAPVTRPPPLSGRDILILHQVFRI